MFFNYLQTICLQLLKKSKFLAIFGFLGTPSQNGPMVKSGMTQGKSEIVSGTNFGSKNEKLEPFS